MSTNDIIDYIALDRLWSPKHWFSRVGRTRRQREGLTRRRRVTGPRGHRLAGRVRTTADAISGEVQR